MYKQKPKYFVFLFLFLISTKIHTQIVVTPSTGCAPLSVVFSGPAGATAVFWNLGPGIGTSTLATPNPLYISGGTYNITYSAIVNGNAVNYSSQIVVAQAPKITFSYQLPASRCAPLTATFTASGGSPGSTYSWAFGDLSPINTGANLLHTYNFSNSFIPVMTLFDAATGCTSIATPASGGTIHVSNKPVINILSSNGFVGCNPPFSTILDGATSVSGSPLGGGLTFNWSMNSANPSSSGSSSPGSVTFGQGLHTITLTTTDNNQCSNSATAQISVISPTLIATVSPTVCLNGPVSATVNSPQNLVTFDINGFATPTSFSIPPNVPHEIDTVCFFNTPGLQQMTLSVQASGICPSYTVQKSVFVEQVIASFTNTPPHSTCGPSIVANYINTSSVNTSHSLTFEWFLAWPANAHWQGVPTNTTINSMANTSFTFSVGSKNPYTIYKLFTPYITMKATSNSIAQCTASILHVDYDTLARPTAFFNLDKRKGCSPLTVKFRDSSFYSPSHPVPVTNYTWCNGATPSLTAIGTLTATFTYTTGTYYPYLLIETIDGCIDTSFVDTIRVGTPPTVTATFPSTACAGTPVTINMSASATSTLPIDNWHVTTDNGFFSGCFTEQNPSFPFTHVGVHTIIATAYQAGCIGTNTMAQTITIKGPIGKFRHETTCTGNKKSVNFAVHLQEVATATLNYGDGSQVLINGNASGISSQNFAHLYASSGNYTATLVSVNPNNPCQSYSFKQVIKVRDVKAKITYDGQPLVALPSALACTKSKILFSASTSEDNTTSCWGGYKWTYISPDYELPPVICNHPVFGLHPHGSIGAFGDIIARDTFRVAGIYTISLEVQDENYCTSKETVQFRVGNAVPDFTFAANPACQSDGAVQIINNTQASQVPPDLIAKYRWFFGDGDSLVSTDPNNNPSHYYVNVNPPSQTFTVLCIATNTLGCIDSTDIVLQVNNPLTGFVTNNLAPCIPKNQSTSIGLAANQGYNTYSLTSGLPPGNPSWQTFSNFANVNLSFSVPGIYNPSLTIVDAAGCKATSDLTVTAIGQATAGIKFVSAKNFCIPASIRLKDSSHIFTTPITNYVWSIGTISSPPSPADSLSTIFTVPGIYTVGLTVSMNQNQLCPSSSSITVQVYDTRASFTLDKTTFCLGETIKATVTGIKDVYSWQWFFGDLVQQQPIFNTVFAANPINYPYMIYPTSGGDGKAIVVLKAISNAAESCVVTSTMAIQVIKINADFKHINDNYRHCLKPSDTFSSTTLNPLGLNYNLFWSFGDGKSDSGLVVTHTYLKPGVYPVRITVKDAVYSCSNTATKSMTILPLPSAKIALSDSLVCPENTFSIALTGTPGVSGQVTGTLMPSNGAELIFPSSNSLEIPTNASVTTTYTFNVLDANGCRSEPVKATINVPLPAPTINTATTVIVGEQIQLNASAGAGYSYKWTPETRFLSSDSISNPVSSSLADIVYTIQIVDEPLRCFLTIASHSIFVLPLTTIDVPSAFTPNGDGKNDIVFPDGWGIKKLIYFRIYNRWGQLLFETNDINTGWDGTFEGVPQNMETYVYQVEVETYVDETPKLFKTGTIKLIR